MRQKKEYVNEQSFCLGIIYLGGQLKYIPICKKSYILHTSIIFEIKKVHDKENFGYFVKCLQIHLTTVLPHYLSYFVFKVISAAHASLVHT